MFLPCWNPDSTSRKKAEPKSDGRPWLGAWPVLWAWSFGFLFILFRRVAERQVKDGEAFCFKIFLNLTNALPLSPPRDSGGKSFVSQSFSKTLPFVCHCTVHWVLSWDHSCPPRVSPREVNPLNSGTPGSQFNRRDLLLKIHRSQGHVLSLPWSQGYKRGPQKCTFPLVSCFAVFVERANPSAIMTAATLRFILDFSTIEEQACLPPWERQGLR